MEIKTSLESIRDFTIDIINAGKVALIGVMDKIDSKACNAINSPEDEL